MTQALDDIVKQIELSVSVKRAFTHFTANMGDWWPLASHSLAGEAARTVVFEPYVHGAIYEVTEAGERREWGRVQVYEANERLVFSWVLEQPDHATEVEVRFAANGDEASILTLIHRGWHNRPDGATWRANYHAGWDMVLARYTSNELTS